MGHTIRGVLDDALQDPIGLRNSSASLLSNGTRAGRRTHGENVGLWPLRKEWHTDQGMHPTTSS